MMHRDVAVAVVLGSFLTANGCSSPGPAPASPVAREPGAAKTRHWEWTVAPGAMAEVNVRLAIGARMAARYVAEGSAVTWNVHSHDASGTVIHLKGEGPKGAPAYTASAQGVYSFLWINSGGVPARIAVDLEIDGDGAVHSTHP